MQNLRRVGYLLSLVIGAALLTAMVWRPAPPKPFVGLSTGQVPSAVDGYDGTDYALTPQVKEALASASIVSRQYVRGADAIDFVLLGGTSREALHDPRSCLTGAGWDLAEQHPEHLPGTAVDVQACHAVGLPGVPGYDILYLYVVNGHKISTVSQIRRQMLWSALIGRKNEPVYMLRFMMPLTGDPQEEAQNHARLTQFAAQMWTTIQPALQSQRA